MNTTKLITGMVAGFAAGAILGNLFASHGSKAKKNNVKSSRFKKNISSRFNDLVDDVAEEYSTVKAKIAS